MIGVGTTIFLINPQTFGGSSFTNEKSLLFDGVDEYVNCGQPTVFDGATNWSISYWVKFQTEGIGGHPIGYRGASDVTNIQFSYQHTIDAMDFKIGGAYQRTPTSSVLVGQWYHMVAVYDGTQGTNADRLKIYFDGSLVSVTTSGTFATAMGTLSGGIAGREFRIGTYINLEMNGYVDEVSIFDYSLDATQVSSLYNSGTPTDLDNTSGVSAPVHWWRMGDGDTFPTINDIGTGTTFNGTMTNMEAGDIVTDVP